MIDNVFTIIHCKNGLEKTPEYWQKADFEEKLRSLQIGLYNISILPLLPE